jgi:Histidine kinase-, DNA gyrase B-, and HSP90-like ATPase
MERKQNGQLRQDGAQGENSVAEIALNESPYASDDARGTGDAAVQAAIAELLADTGTSPVRLDRMLESLRNAEFDIAAGLGELVDNAVEEKGKNVWIFVKPEKRTFKNKSIDVVGEVAVIDDGGGMTPEILGRCLVLGDTLRAPKTGRAGIGKFGVGMTMGSISLARVIEVYSRSDKNGPFLYTFLDLNLVKAGTQRVIPTPMAKEPPAQYAELLKGSTGTIVILKDCDRLQTDPVEKEKGIAASEQIAGLPTYLGRTYRKFIQAGRQIWLNGDLVYLHDPLYLSGPTVFDAKNPKDPDPKAKAWGKKVELPLEIPDSGGKTANVTIRMSLLPRDWRPNQGAGGSNLAKSRKVTENEGVSILRADREVLYGHVPYIIGKRGVAKFLEIDRFWGCEIAFPPELDAYFHVKYIKRGAEPVSSLRDQIRAQIGDAVASLRKQIQADFEKTKEAELKEAGVFAEAENAMASVTETLPHGKTGAEKTPEETKKEIEEIVEEIVTEVGDETGKTREERKREIETKPYAIVPVRYPSTVFFEPVHQPGRVIVKLNVDHPFYTTVFEPLCGTVESMDEDSPVEMGADTPEKRLARRALMLLLLSYAHAEGFFPNNADLLKNLRGQWGITLGTALSEGSA